LMYAACCIIIFLSGMCGPAMVTSRFCDTSISSGSFHARALQISVMTMPSAEQAAARSAFLDYLILAEPGVRLCGIRITMTLLVGTGSTFLAALATVLSLCLSQLGAVDPFVDLGVFQS